MGPDQERVLGLSQVYSRGCAGVEAPLIKEEVYLPDLCDDKTYFLTRSQVMHTEQLIIIDPNLLALPACLSSQGKKVFQRIFVGVLGDDVLIGFK